MQLALRLVICCGTPGGSCRIPPKLCSTCGMHETPQWRCGPKGRTLQCNAYGVRLLQGHVLGQYVGLGGDELLPASSPEASSLESGSCQIAQRTICSNGPSAGNNESLLLAGTLAPRHGPYGLRRRTTPRITATWGREPRPCLAVGAKAYAPKAGSGRTKQACRNCLTRSTPQWRVGPEGPNTLCNACGMRMRKGHILKRYADWGSKKELGTSALKSALACSTRS